jgi:hypothetical protein
VYWLAAICFVILNGLAAIHELRLASDVARDIAVTQMIGCLALSVASGVAMVYFSTRRVAATLFAIAAIAICQKQTFLMLFAFVTWSMNGFAP